MPLYFLKLLHNYMLLQSFLHMKKIQGKYVKYIGTYILKAKRTSLFHVLVML
jgi:hypothetical protein